MGRGRETKLTKPVHDKIVKLMRDGNYFRTACNAAGIPEATGHKWLAWGEGRDYASKGECPKDNTIFRDFREAVKKAEADAVADIVVEVRKGVPKDPKLGLEFLRRRHNAEWGRDRKEIQVEGTMQLKHDVSQTLAKYAEAFNDDEDDGYGSGSAEGGIAESNDS